MTYKDNAPRQHLPSRDNGRLPRRRLDALRSCHEGERRAERYGYTDIMPDPYLLTKVAAIVPLLKLGAWTFPHSRHR